MSSTIESASRRYQGIVFKIAPPSPDFACSTEIVLPGQHTAQDAWAAVYKALEMPTGRDLVGGEIRPC